MSEHDKDTKQDESELYKNRWKGIEPVIAYCYDYCDMGKLAIYENFSVHATINGFYCSSREIWTKVAQTEPERQKK